MDYKKTIGIVGIVLGSFLPMKNYGQENNVGIKTDFRNTSLTIPISKDSTVKVTCMKPYSYLESIFIVPINKFRKTFDMWRNPIYNYRVIVRDLEVNGKIVKRNFLYGTNGKEFRKIFKRIEKKTDYLLEKNKNYSIELDHALYKQLKKTAISSIPYKSDF